MIDLTKFCAPEDDTRSVLTWPHHMGLISWASDGALAVWVPDPDNAGEWPESNALYPTIQSAMVTAGDETYSPYTPLNAPVNDAPVAIGNAFFDASRLRLLASLPGVEISTGPFSWSMAVIRFDGGRGAIMPVKVETPEG